MRFTRGAGWAPTSGELLPVSLEVTDPPGRDERDITGSIGDLSAQPALDPGSGHGVDLNLTRDRVSGRLAGRTFDLHARGDDYVGSFQLGLSRVPFVLRGIDQMWAMPAAAQAAILPLLLTCSEPTRVIQIVDLRQADTPPPTPPPWLSPTRPIIITQPQPRPTPSSNSPSPQRNEPHAAPQLAHRD